MKDVVDHRSSAYLGLDVGASSLSLILIDGADTILESVYYLVGGERAFPQDMQRNRCAISCDTCMHPCGIRLIVQKVDEFVSSCCDKFNVKIAGFGGTGSQVKKGTTFPIPLDILVSEVSAHGRGMHHASNTENVEAIIDVGGQDSKVICLSNPLEFHMSGLCAAGTGAYLDEIARVENIGISEFGDIGGEYIERYIRSLDTNSPLQLEKFSAVCTVFTKSSYVKKRSLLTLEERIAAICWAQANQIYNTVIHHLRDYCGKISFQGGVSFNLGVRLALDYFLKKGRSLVYDAEPVLVIPEIEDYCDDTGETKPISHLMGALGAALLGKEYVDIARDAIITKKICPSLRSSRKRKDFLKKQISLSLGREASRPKVAWCGTLFPSEICYLFDIVPIALPVLAAIDNRNTQEYLLRAAKEEGLDRANCTILSSVLGRLDRTPPPDFILYTSGSCDYYRQHMLRVIDVAHKQFGLDPEKQSCSVDLPTYTYDDGLSVEFVANQLRRIVSRIEDTLKVKHDPDKLRSIITNVNKSREYHLRTEDLRAKSPALAFGSDLLKRAVLYSSGWGSDQFVEITKSYYEELAERACSLSSGADPVFSLGEKHRILWVYLWDYTYPSLFKCLEHDLGCAIVAEELNHIHWPAIDPERPFEGIARRIVQPINHVKRRMSYLMEMAEKYRADGIIFFIHFFGHCPLASETIQNMLRKSGYPVLFLEGDCLDATRRTSSIITKVQAFVEQLNEMKYGNIFGVETDVAPTRPPTKK